MAFMKKIFSRDSSSSSTGGSKMGTSSFNKKYILTDKLLGSGSYAQVRLGRDKSSQATVAVKIIDKTHLSPRELKGLMKEVNILNGLNHQNVVRIYDYFDQKDEMYIVMEYVNGGELYEKVMMQDYTEGDVQKIIRKLAVALKYCKENGVIHRDLKPQNLLLTKPDQRGNSELKLADFNLSTKIDKDQADFSLLQTMCGTPNYVSPEVLSQKPYSYKCDIWSMGVIAYLMLSGGHLPFHVEEDGDHGKNLLLEAVRQGRWGFFPEESWRSVSADARDFLEKVMQPRPEKRIDYDEILNHPWLKGTESDILIDATGFQQSQYKRKMMSAGKLLLATKAFESLMKKNGKDEIENTPPPAANVSFLTSLGQSSTDGFAMFDH